MEHKAGKEKAQARRRKLTPATELPAHEDPEQGSMAPRPQSDTQPTLTTTTTTPIGPVADTPVSSDPVSGPVADTVAPNTTTVSGKAETSAAEKVERASVGDEAEKEEKEEKEEKGQKSGKTDTHASNHCLVFPRFSNGVLPLLSLQSSTRS